MIKVSMFPICTDNGRESIVETLAEAIAVLKLRPGQAYEIVGDRGIHVASSGIAGGAHMPYRPLEHLLVVDPNGKPIG